MHNRRHYRTIVADDDEDVRLLVRRYLERSGRFTVIADATGGEQAIALAEKHQPDLIVLDLLMPDTDGLVALPRIRTVAPQTTVVVASGMQRPHLEEDVLAAGAAGLLAKQPSWRAFVDDLLRVLGPEPAEHTGDGARRLDLHLSSDLRSGHVAREFLRDVLRAWEVRHLLDDAELLVSELINNAVVHAGSSVRLRVILHHQRLRMEIADTGGGALHRRNVRLTDDNGRGLFLVDALSSTWGTSASSQGKTVWCELEAKPEGG